MAKAFIPYELDKMRNLRYSLRALSLIEENIGIPLARLDVNSISIKHLSIMIWAGLYHEDKDLTPDMVMDLIDDYSDMDKANEAMIKALDEAFGEKNKKAVAKNGTGKRH